VPFWPSRGVRTGTVDEPPSRGTHRPLVGFGGAPRTRIASTLDGYWFHPARAAFRRPSGSTRCDLPRSRSRAGALHTLSCPFRGVRHSPARSRRPVGRLDRPCNLSWAFCALRHDLGAMARDDHGSHRGPPAAYGGLATSCATTPSPLPAREAPERPWAFPFRASSPCTAVPPFRGPALLSLPVLAPHREVHTRTRSATGLCSRHGLVRSPTLAGRPVDALLGLPPPEPSPHPSGRSALVARPPLTPPSRADVPARQGHRVLRSEWIGVVRFRTAGSLGVRHLLTVAALRSPGPGAGSWLHLASGARLSPPSRCSEPPGTRCSLWPGP